MTDLFFYALWFNALGCGLMAGLYFAFSTFIMTALARIPEPHGISAMQSINRVILRSLFMPLFFATTLVSVSSRKLGERVAKQRPCEPYCPGPRVAASVAGALALGPGQ